LQITKVTKNKEDGSTEVQLMLTEEQTAFLINFALGMLTQQGVVSYFELDGEKVVEGDNAEQGAVFLNSLDPKDIALHVTEDHSSRVSSSARRR